VVRRELLDAGPDPSDIGDVTGAVDELNGVGG